MTGLRVAYRLSERLNREIEGKEKKESHRIIDKYSYLIGKAIDRHVLLIGKSKSQTK